MPALNCIFQQTYRQWDLFMFQIWSEGIRAERGFLGYYTVLIDVFPIFTHTFANCTKKQTLTNIYRSGGTQSATTMTKSTSFASCHYKKNWDAYTWVFPSSLAVFIIQQTGTIQPKGLNMRLLVEGLTTVTCGSLSFAWHLGGMYYVEDQPRWFVCHHGHW